MYGHIPVPRFLCILQMLVSEPASSSHALLPTIITFVMEQVYPAVSKVTHMPSTIIGLSLNVM